MTFFYPFDRRFVRLHLSIFGFLAILGFSQSSAALAQPIMLVDAAQNTVVLDRPARRLVLGWSQDLTYLALLERDPISKVIGWSSPASLDAGLRQAFEQRFPAIKDVAVVGQGWGELSLEAVIRLDADLIVLPMADGKWTAVADRLRKIGIPVIFLSSAATRDRPLDDSTAFSIRLLGKAIGASEKAERYVEVYEQHYRKLVEKVPTNEKRPAVLFEGHAGPVCCASFGKAGQPFDAVAIAGGRNIAYDVISGSYGQLSAEYVVSQDPEIYIGTGGPHMRARGGLVIGAGISRDDALASLREILSRPGFSALTAVKTGNAHAISHQLWNSPLSIVALEAIATWIHPRFYADVNPEQTLSDINRNFLAVPLEGTFWITESKTLSVDGPE